MPILRLTLRFLLPLICVLGLLALGSLQVVDRLMFTWSENDLGDRSRLIENALHDSLIATMQTGNKKNLQLFFNRVIQNERLFAIGLCSFHGELLYRTSTFPSRINCSSPEVVNDTAGTTLRDGADALHVAAQTLVENGQRFGKLILVHDMSFAVRRSLATKEYIFYFFIILGAVISFSTILIVQFTVRGWVTGLRSLLKGNLQLSLFRGVPSREFLPVVKDLRTLVRDLERDQRTRDESQMSWTAKSLKEILNVDLRGDEILIVSNREPYLHQRKGDKIEVQFPASGLVTSLEPVMRACSGTWVAHGSGTADHEVVDQNDHVQVPPDHPTYQIRRVWLSKEEELGYYYGFSNEGLWPLCHMAHTRPIFRASDFEMYQRVNQKFAQAVIEEAKTKDPVILVQDYHFSLLPRLIRERLPEATIITFWHIPWPNFETFGICPWKDQILEGLLGSSILGFHTRYDCNNFIETVDRYLETRIDRETQTISFGGKPTMVRNYPISIEWPSRWIDPHNSIHDCRLEIRRRHELRPEILVGIGVDRLDYTKGIIERFLAVERLIEVHPEWRGRFTFIQIAAPSRSILEHYRNFEAEVVHEAHRINERFRRNNVDLIILKIEHHSPAQVFEYYRAADLCMVTSLHDGMNLVAKEYVSAREDELGVLILSQFTGASRELPESLIVNPYDINQCADALQSALTMHPIEQRERMRSMRSLVREYNVYRWAGRMLLDAARMRQKNRLYGRIQENENLRVAQ